MKRQASIPSKAINPVQQAALRRLVQAGVSGDKRSHQLALRARAILLIAEGRPVKQIAGEMGVWGQVIRQWWKRFSMRGVAGLMPPEIPPLPIGEEQRRTLHELADYGEYKDRRSQRVALRAQVILLAAEGLNNIEITRRLSVKPFLASQCRRRFTLWGIPGILREPTTRIPELNAPDRATLEQLAQAQVNGATIARALEARAILLAAEGKSNIEISRSLGQTRSTVVFWRQRFARVGMAGLGHQHKAPPLLINPKQRTALKHIIAEYRDAQGKTSRVVLRAKAVLLAGQGENYSAIERALGVSNSQVQQVCRRFSAGGVQGILPPALRALPISVQQRRDLKRMVQAGQRGNWAARVTGLRAGIILLAAQGATDEAIARQTHKTAGVVRKLRNRFARLGIPGITQQGKVFKLPVSLEQRASLTRLINAGPGRVQQMIARRARVVLMTAEGTSLRDIRRALRISAKFAIKWRRRFAQSGVPALMESPQFVLPLTDGQRTALTRLADPGADVSRVKHLIARRAKTILLAAEGKSCYETSLELGIAEATVAQWRSRFIRLGMAGIESKSLVTALPVSSRQRRRLMQLVQTGEGSPRTAQTNALRAKMILLAAEGKSHSEIARELHVGMKTIAALRRRFRQHGVAGVIMK